MNAALVKIDVAAADLDRSVAQVFDLVDGGTLLEKGITWVFNLANDPDGDRRDLRFWRPEVLAHGHRDIIGKYADWPIERVLAKILPEKRVNFHAGEVDKLFQIRPRTRIDLHGELAGALDGGRNFYSRAALAAFLTRRWLGAVSKRKPFSPAADVAASTATKNGQHAGHIKPPSVPAKLSCPKSAAHIPASPATTMQRRKVLADCHQSNLPAPASLSGAVTFHMEQK